MPIPPVMLLTGESVDTVAALAVTLAQECVVFTARTLAEGLRRLGHHPADVVVLALDRDLLNAMLMVRTLLTRAPSCRAYFIATHEQMTRLPPRLIPAGPLVVSMPCPVGELVGSVAGMIWGPRVPGALRWDAIPLVPRAVTYLTEHKAESLTLKAVAGALMTSPGFLAHTFRAGTGMTPRQFVLRVRLEVAKLLLSGTDLKLSAVAVRAGFCDAPHLSRLFRAHVGCWPGEYRRLARDPVSHDGDSSVQAVAHPRRARTAGIGRPLGLDAPPTA